MHRSLPFSHDFAVAVAKSAYIKFETQVTNYRSGSLYAVFSSLFFCLLFALDIFAHFFRVNYQQQYICARVASFRRVLQYSFKSYGLQSLCRVTLNAFSLTSSFLHHVFSNNFAANHRFTWQLCFKNNTQQLTMKHS